MNIKPAYFYQLNDHKRAVITFYCVIAALLVAVSLSVLRVGTSGTVKLGLDGASVVFIFILGLCSFREPFLMLIQNGVTRKSAYQSWLLAALTIALVMAVLDKIVLLTGKAVGSITDNLQCLSTIEQIYNMLKEGPVLRQIIVFFFDLLLYAAAASAGYLITVLFYRTNKYGKVAIGAGVPVFLFFVFPILDYALFKSVISKAIVGFMDFAFGITAQNPYMGMITLAVLFAVFSLFSWLLIRKAEVKR
jgi:hypothetical protein